ncbi:MAG: SMP-30/gluconolactonase/LRE family protein [Fimbriimonas sp.]
MNLLPAELRPVADYACHTGEGPTWHPLEKVVYWTDIPQGKLFRYDPATERHEQVYSGRIVGGMTVQTDGKLLLFLDNGGVALWDQGMLDLLIDELPGERGNRFNDVIADPEGRVFCGTMSTKEIPGRLYRLDKDLKMTIMVEGTGTSNGMGYTKDLKKMFFTDTRPGEIYVFDYERATGALHNQKVHIKVDDGAGRPDGMTVDDEETIWSTRWDGSCMVRYAPNGEELGRVLFPTKKISSITFGGEDYTDAYVTTAGGQDKPANGDLAGALFQAQLGVKGRQEFFSRIVL